MIARMPFGKYRGCPLTSIPADYLEWLLTIDLRYPLKIQVLNEMRRRKEEAATRRRQAEEAARRQEERRQQEARTTSVTTLDIASISDKWFRRLSRKWHPDVGGTKEAMQAL